MSFPLKNFNLLFLNSFSLLLHISFNYKLSACGALILVAFSSIVMLQQFRLQCIMLPFSQAFYDTQKYIFIPFTIKHSSTYCVLFTNPSTQQSYILQRILSLLCFSCEACLMVFWTLALYLKPSHYEHGQKRKKSQGRLKVGGSSLRKWDRIKLHFPSLHPISPIISLFCKPVLQTIIFRLDRPQERLKWVKDILVLDLLFF